MARRWGAVAAGLAAVIGVRYFDKKLLNEYNQQLYKMGMQRDVLDHMLSLKHSHMKIDMYLKKMGYKKVGIYGLTMLGSHVYEELHSSEYVSRLVGIDRRRIYDNYDMEIFRPEEDFAPLDLIIVTALGDYEKIVSMLSKVFPGRIMSIQQIINECESIYFNEAVCSEKTNRNYCDL